MEEQESILYVVLLVVTLFIMPGPLVGHPLEFISLLVTIGTVILIGTTLILIAVKNIPVGKLPVPLPRPVKDNPETQLGKLPIPPPIGLGDKFIKQLAWISILVVGVIIVTFNTISILS